jgi:hypothetical protein
MLGRSRRDCGNHEAAKDGKGAFGKDWGRSRRDCGNHEAGWIGEKKSAAAIETKWRELLTTAGHKELGDFHISYVSYPFATSFTEKEFKIS